MGIERIANQLGNNVSLLFHRAVYGMALAGNTIVQEIKRDYFEFTGTRYREVTEDEDAETDFPYYVRY